MKKSMYGSFNSIFTTSFFSLEEALPINDKDGEGYYRITGMDSVICCILDQNDSFVMVRQYRPNLEALTLETPAGGLEFAENAMQAARREIQEETGLICALLPVGQTFSLMMNRTNIKDHLFFGMNPESIPNHVQETGLDVLRVPRKKLFKSAICGDYRQLGALGLLFVTGGILQVDMWNSPFEVINQAFGKHPKVEWPIYG